MARGDTDRREAKVEPRNVSLIIALIGSGAGRKSAVVCPSLAHEVSSDTRRDQVRGRAIRAPLREGGPAVTVEDLHVDAGAGLLVVAEFAHQHVAVFPEFPDHFAWHLLTDHGRP